MANPVLINTTPHTVSLYLSGDTVVDYPPDKQCALRLIEQPGEKYADEHGVPVHGPPQWVGLSWLEFPRKDIEGKIDLLVSMPVGNYLRERGMGPMLRESGVWNVYGPNTGPDKVVRNDAGQIVGTTELILYA